MRSRWRRRPSALNRLSTSRGIGYGLAFHPETGELWQAEIDPMSGDEVNILLPGHNYGWPLVSMGRNYTGTLVSDEPWFRRR